MSKRNMIVCDGHHGEIASEELRFEVKVTPTGWAASNGGKGDVEGMPAELDLCQRCFTEFSAAYRQLLARNTTVAAVPPSALVDGPAFVPVYSDPASTPPAPPDPAKPHPTV
jgi:hypothetical protein